MNLIAYMIVKNEAGRYLIPCLESLVTYCDEVRVWNDGSTDDTEEICHAFDRVACFSTEHSFFDRHEGLARQRALDWALKANPTHILAIDADEFVDNGALLRACLEENAAAIYKLNMVEVWKATESELLTRQDGGWREHDIPICYTARRGGKSTKPNQRIPNRKMASGRVPVEIAQQRTSSASTGVSILHFGWTCEADRERRYRRYLTVDGGNYHARRHLDSIMWPDARVTLHRRLWPAALEEQKQSILKRVA